MLTTLRHKMAAFFKPNAAFDCAPLDYSVPPSFAARLPWVDIDTVCSGQVKLATVLGISQNSCSDLFGVRPPLY